MVTVVAVPVQVNRSDNEEVLRPVGQAGDLVGEDVGPQRHLDVIAVDAPVVRNVLAVREDVPRDRAPAVTRGGGPGEGHGPIARGGHEVRYPPRPRRRRGSAEHRTLLFAVPGRVHRIDPHQVVDVVGQAGDGDGGTRPGAKLPGVCGDAGRVVVGSAVLDLVLGDRGAAVIGGGVPGNDELLIPGGDRQVGHLPGYGGGLGGARGPIAPVAVTHGVHRVDPNQVGGPVVQTGDLVGAGVGPQALGRLGFTALGTVLVRLTVTQAMAPDRGTTVVGSGPRDPEATVPGGDRQVGHLSGHIGRGLRRRRRGGARERSGEHSQGERPPPPAPERPRTPARIAPTADGSSVGRGRRHRQQRGRSALTPC